MAECLELDCLCQDHTVSFGTVFLQDCVTETKAGVHQKLQQQETSQGMLNKHKAQPAIQTQPYIFLTLTTLPNFFHMGALFSAVERNCSKPVTFQLILN